MAARNQRHGSQQMVVLLAVSHLGSEQSGESPAPDGAAAWSTGPDSAGLTALLAHTKERLALSAGNTN